MINVRKVEKEKKVLSVDFYYRVIFKVYVFLSVFFGECCYFYYRVENIVLFFVVFRIREIVWVNIMIKEKIDFVLYIF